MLSLSRHACTLLSFGLAACAVPLDSEEIAPESSSAALTRAEDLAQRVDIAERPLAVASDESADLPLAPAQPEIARRPLVQQVARAGSLTDAKASTFRPLQLSVSGISLQDGNLRILGSSANDAAAVSMDSRGNVTATLGLKQLAFRAGSVTSIEFSGGDGDDRFSNATDLPSTINGGDGNDILDGSSGADFIVGGYGQDTIHGNAGDDAVWGSGGSDVLYGDDGSDVIFGHGGSDQIHGGAARDTLNGGSGNDTLWGDAGNDLIVTVGLGADTVTGGPQWDNFWIDTSDEINDISANEAALGYVHEIASFRSVSYLDGPSVAVGLQPTGENLPDPVKYAAHTGSLTDYADHPLFASSGPSKDDIFQGNVGDCYFMARLSAIAMQEPEYIRKLVAPLGDGSYAVRFYRNGQPDYVRVDSDFWAHDGALLYAREGQEGAIWVPVVEKAFAIARRDQGSYESISGGNGTTLSSMNYESVSSEIADGLSAEQVKSWHDSGEPANRVELIVGTSVKSLLTVIDYYLSEGLPMITGAVSGIKDTTVVRLDDPNTSAQESTYRRGQHIYAIDHVMFDSNDEPTSLVLRDPYGAYRTITDPTRLHFCIGRGVRLEF
jgi:Calpain family cysteine protease/RTX calcium-binding nonapeptide repeat (4 copies)